MLRSAFSKLRGLVGRPARIVVDTHEMRLSEAAEQAKTLAFAAVDRGDYQTALSAWIDVCEKRPDWSIGYAGRAGALRALQRSDEAKEILLAGLRQFPDDPVLTVEYGYFLVANSDLDGALLIWRHGLMAHGDQPVFHVGLATTLRTMLRFDEADTVLAAATEQFPENCLVASNYAVTADVRGDRAESLRRWLAVMRDFPGEPVAYAGVGASFKMLGQFKNADDVLAQGMTLFPDDKNIAFNHAGVASEARDWQEAVARWSKLHERWPDDGSIETELSLAAGNSRMAAAEDGAVADLDNPVASPDADLLMRFESLGENCELGFVQRHYKAEPLSLFRWAGISFDKLLEALDHEFAGIGEPEHTIVSVYRDNGEYFIEDARYGMHLHSFIFDVDASPEFVKARMCRRTTFLKAKLIDDLRNPEKIFVFNGVQPLSDADLRRLHAALCRYGPNALLHVAPHPDIPPGTVATVAAGIWRGSLNRTGNNGVAWDIDFESWLLLSRAVDALNVPNEVMIDA